MDASEVLSLGQKIKASKPELSKASPGPGNRPIFLKDEFDSKMTIIEKDGTASYLGSAANLFYIDLSCWAMPGSSLCMEEVEAHASEAFPVICDGFAPQLPTAIPIAVTDLASPGEYGTWRNMGMDLDMYAFLQQWDRMSTY